MPPQGYSKGTLVLATAARNVAETAIPRAFKNGAVPTVPKSGTIAITPFPKHWNQCLPRLIWVASFNVSKSEPGTSTNPMMVLSNVRAMACGPLATTWSYSAP